MFGRKILILIIVFCILIVCNAFLVPSIINVGSNLDSNIIFTSIRLPKTITAICVGIGLSACGFMLQQLFKNPLAGPYALGISSGASLAVGIIIIGLPAFSFLELGIFKSLSIAFVGTLGALGVLLIVLLVSFKYGYGYILLLLGVVIGQITGALQSLLDVLANPTDLKLFSLWSMGSFGKTTDVNLIILMGITCLCFVWSLRLMPALGTMILGDETAKSLGVNTGNISIQILLCTGILTGVSTAFCGPIAFIGMAVPNVAKIIFKTANYKHLLLGTCLIGSIMALLCDTISHLPVFSVYLPINVTTALIGGPIIIYILLKK